MSINITTANKISRPPDITISKRMDVLSASRPNTTMSMGKRPINVTKSCRFAPRCVYAKPECFENEPQLEEIEKDHFVKCHFVREINGL